jgi:hypothetical protein
VAKLWPASAEQNVGSVGGDSPPSDGTTAEYTSIVNATVECPTRSQTALGSTPALSSAASREDSCDAGSRPRAQRASWVSNRPTRTGAVEHRVREHERLRGMPTARNVYRRKLRNCRPTPS